MDKLRNNPNIDPINHPNEKRCTKCKEWVSYDEYYKDSRASDGYASQCRICNLKYRNKEAGKYTHIRNRPHEPEGMRWCSHCELVKSESEFSMGRKGLRRECEDCRRKDGREYVATHKEQRAKYKANNYEHILTIGRAYHHRNKEKFNKKSKEWRKKNPTKFRLGVGVSKAKKPELYKANSTLKQSRRRMRLSTLPNDYTIADWERALEYFNYRCAVCNQPENRAYALYIAADHWQPLAKSDKGTVVDNIIPLCHNGVGSPLFGTDSGCNNRKSAKNPEQWLRETYDEITAEEILRRINTYFEWATLEKAKVTAAKEAEMVEVERLAKTIEEKKAKTAVSINDRRLKINKLPNPDTKKS